MIYSKNNKNTTRNKTNPSLSLCLSGLSSHNPFNSKLLSIWLTCLSQAPRCVSWSFPLKISAKFTSRTFINCFKEWGFVFAVDAGQLIWVQITKHKDTAISSLSFSSPYFLLSFNRCQIP